MKFGKFAKYYAVATQGIISIVVLTFLGLFIGYLIDKDSYLSVILGIVGMISALSSMVFILIKLQREDGKKEDEKSQS
ncbi:MAG: hypothetical protein J6R47_04830 [Acholeplasmatales bacterium]|nr:hypothetical protein [Acholeplasmatales bacterium]